MRGRLTIALGGFLCVAVLTTAFVRWSYFSQEPHPFLRLSDKQFPRLTDRLVIVLVDSVPFDMAFDPRNMPYVASLKERATWGMGRTEEPTMTGQMVYTIVTGARPYVYAVVRNWRQNRMPHETFFDGLREQGLRLDVFGDVPWTQLFGDRFDRTFTRPEEGRTPEGRPYIWFHAVNDLDRLVIKHLDRALVRPDFDVLVWHMHGTDLVMHKYLRDTRLTRDKLHWADLLVQGIVNQLDDGRTTFLLLSDHGCAANGRHGYEDPEANHTFYALFGPRIVKNQRLDIRQVDLSPTVSALFGRTPGAVSAGRPAVEALKVPEAERAKRLQAAVRNRQQYLAAREKRLSTGVHVDPALAKAALVPVSGDPKAVEAAATRYLRAARKADLDARRERRVLLPIVVWLLFAAALIAWGVLLSRSLAEPGPPRSGRRGAHLIGAAGVVIVVWAAALLASKVNGRFFNDHFDLWHPGVKLGLLGAVVAAIAGPVILFRRRIAGLFSAQPLIWTWTAFVLAGTLPGYFQGLYTPVMLMLALGALLLWKDRDGARPWLAALLALVILAVFVRWAYHWRPHFFFVRDHVKGGIGAAAAAVTYGLAVLAVGRPWRREDGEDGEPAQPSILWPGLVLTVLLAVRHVAWPQPALLDVPTAGDQLLWGLNVRVIAAGGAGLLWLLLRRLGLRGPDGAALGALAALCAWGSPYAAAAFSLIVVALAPLGRAKWLQGSGLGVAAAAAVLMVLGRVLCVQPHEFYFNFTAVHDLLRFAPDTDKVASTLAAPVLVRYTLPALVLLPLLWGRLASSQRLAALLLVLLYVGARELQLLMVTRLTIDQLYANWRGLGELIINGLWALGLALGFVLWQLGLWADRIPLRGRRASAEVPDPAAT